MRNDEFSHGLGRLLVIVVLLFVGGMAIFYTPPSESNSALKGVYPNFTYVNQVDFTADGQLVMSQEGKEVFRCWSLKFLIDNKLEVKEYPQIINCDLSSKLAYIGDAYTFNSNIPKARFEFSYEAFNRLQEILSKYGSNYYICGRVYWF